jgi:hypothetical protein
MYGLGNVILYELLGRAGLPTFYDKLLPVPIMNLSIKLIDRFAGSRWLTWLDPARLGRTLPPLRRNLAYVAVWASVFVTLHATGAVGDRHPGHTVPFWQQACLDNARKGCENLAVILDTYCRDGSGWACNEVGVLRWNRRVEAYERFGSDFVAGCANGFGVSCQNIAVLKAALRPPRQAPPTLNDYPVVLRTGKGALPDTGAVALLTAACDQGWPVGCEDLGAIFLKGDGVPRDPGRAAVSFERSCDLGLATACANLGLMHYSADGLPKDEQKGLDYLQRACDLGQAQACTWLKSRRQ